MPLPELSDFEALIRSLSLAKPKNAEGHGSAIVSDRRIMADENLEPHEFPERTIWFKPSGQIHLETLLSRIGKELQANGHANSPEIRNCIIQFIALHPDKNTRPISVTNELVGNLIECAAKHYHILPLSLPIEWSFNLYGYRFHKLDNGKLKYQCERADSDYYTRYRHRLKGAYTVERDFDRCLIIDFPKVRDLVLPHIMNVGRPDFFELWQSLGWDYFHGLAQPLVDEFWSALAELQEILIASGAPAVEVDSLRSLPMSQFVTIFSRKETPKIGFVVPRGVGGRGANHHIGAPHVPWLMADEDPDPKPRQMLRHLRCPDVGPGDEVLHVMEDLRYPAHPGAANPHEMDMPVSLHHRSISGPVSLPARLGERSPRPSSANWLTRSAT